MAERIVYRHTAGFLAIFTLLFFLGGIALMCASVLGVFANAKPGASYAAFGFGLLLFLAGGAVSFGSWDIEIDHEVVVRLGVLGLYRVRRYPLQQFVAVRIAMDPTGVADRFKVLLAGREQSVYLTEFTEPHRAQEEAERVARALGLPVTE